MNKLLLISLALLLAASVSVTSCGGGVGRYNLTMAASPVDGGTATDETRGSPYLAGTRIQIKAAETGDYVFVHWSAPAGTFKSTYDEQTIFTMPAEDVTVTANFVGPLDQTTFYEVDPATAPNTGDVVTLRDKFGTFSATVGKAVYFGGPAETTYDNVTKPISYPNHFLTVYQIDCEEGPVVRWVQVDNQFGLRWLTVSGPAYLAVPTQQTGHEPPVVLDHFLIYNVTAGGPMDVPVSLSDQFGSHPRGAVYQPKLFADPVRKTHGGIITEIGNPDAYWVVYSLQNANYFEEEVQVVNQFGGQTLDVRGEPWLGVPSAEAVIWEQPPLDHFKCYAVGEVAPVEEDVCLEDQFGTFNATVGGAFLFGNPADKLHGYYSANISNPDNHLTAYNLTCEGEPREWIVEIYNQFGYQQMTVSGPVGLVAPTEEYGQGPPSSLDHFLLYEVIRGSSVDELVGLNDEWGQEPDVPVYKPVFFANPVRKTHGGNITEIGSPEGHLVFYAIDGGASSHPDLRVANQFGAQTLDVEYPICLAVPSEKIYWVELEPQPEVPLAVAAVLGDYGFQLTNLLRAGGVWTEQRGWDVISDIGDYDVLVVNRPDYPGETTFQDFLDAASGNGTGVVFTSSYPGNYTSWGISLLEWYLSDPAGQDFEWGEGAVSYKVLEAHPIFDGWDVGDEITIITGGDCDHTWFWDYSGNVTAQVRSSSGGIKGDAVAVSTYGGSTHVLLSSLGPQSYTNENDWTEDGRKIFVNAVLFASGILI